LRLRLAAVLAFASVPGIVLGALEAQRSFAVAGQTEQQQLDGAAQQVAARLDEMIASATILAESLAESPLMRGPACTNSLAAAAAQSDRFAGIARVDAGGRVVCSSVPQSVGLSVADAAWFKTSIASQTPLLSPSRIARIQKIEVVSVSAPIHEDGRPVGVIVTSLRGDWLLRRAASSLGRKDTSLVLFDSVGAPFADFRGKDPSADIRAQAQRVVSGGSPPAGMRAASVETAGGGVRIVVLAEKSKTLGYRSLLIAAAPLLAVLASLAAVWFALQRWVLSWIDRLVVRAKGDPAHALPAATLAGAPQELQTLGDALDAAILNAGARTKELSEALENNLTLNRELHHRVKNSLQVFSSGLARQFRRTRAQAARDALLEARVRLLPFSLTIQYSPAREDLTLIDTAGYLPELARQISAVIGAQHTPVALTIDCDHLLVSNEMAAALGMIVAETLACAFLSGAGTAEAPLALSFKVGAEGEARLECGASTETSDAAKLDYPLIMQLARQIGGEAKIEAGPRVIVLRPAIPFSEDSVLEPSAASGV
jgi:two-component sensor histidine kinase